ncbi:MAG: ATP-grasp domain-containing protein [Candidatus Hodarchaeales archaeon]
MRGTVFITEFITGGGCASESLDRTLFPEGFSMLHSIIKAYKKQDFDVKTTLDHRELWIGDLLGAFITPIRTTAEYFDAIIKLAKKADHIICIAPESFGILEKVATLLERANIRGYHGPSPEAIQQLSNKYDFARYCRSKEINHPKTLLVECLSKKVLKKAFNTLNKAEIVSKPFLGAGSEGIRLHAVDSLNLKPENNEQPVILQPYLEGKHYSATFMVTNQKPVLLSINEQDIDVSNEFQYNGGSYPALNEKEVIMTLPLEVKKLVDNIIRDFNIRGFFGIDFIKYQGNIYTIEINLRPTTPLASLLNNSKLDLASSFFLEKSVDKSDLSTAIYTSDSTIFKKLEFHSNTVLSNEFVKENFRNNFELLSPLFPVSNPNDGKNSSLVSYICMVSSTGADRTSTEKIMGNIKKKLQEKIDEHFNNT